MFNLLIVGFIVFIVVAIIITNYCYFLSLISYY